MFFTTHSPIETYKQCPFKRYLEYHHLGTGIRPIQKNIPLTTGAEIHTGVTYLLNQLRQGKFKVADIDTAVTIALCNYHDTCSNAGYLQPNQLPEQEQFTYNEQKTLIEALIRVWAKVELPFIIQYYNVLEVEKEIPLPLWDEGILGSRADAILQRKDGKQITVYSLKTIKRWDSKRERSYRKDTQCVTETEAVRYWLTERAKVAQKAVVGMHDINSIGIPKAQDILNYLQSFTTVPATIGVQFCYLIKGERREGKVDNGNTSKTETDSLGFDTWHSNRSPLLSCFVKFTPGGVEFAHTNKVVKLENKSGFGFLGKGWTEQYVWECYALGKPEDRVRNWINMLPTLQPGLEERLGRILDKSVIRPVEVFVSPERAKQTMFAIMMQEQCIEANLNVYEDVESIEMVFPRNEHHCHWPSDCEFNPICWNEEIYSSSPFHVSVDSVLESGFYERRESHYKLESVYQDNRKEEDRRNTANGHIVTGDAEQAGREDTQTGRISTRFSISDAGYGESFSNTPEGCSVESDTVREALERE